MLCYIFFLKLKIEYFPCFHKFSGFYLKRLDFKETFGTTYDSSVSIALLYIRCRVGYYVNELNYDSMVYQHSIYEKQL